MVVFKWGPVFRMLLGLFFLASVVPHTLFAATKSKPAGGSYFVYVASSTGPAATNSIYGYRFNSSTGQLTPIGKMAEAESVSWIATDPRHRYLYAAAEDSKNGHGMVSAFSIDNGTGSLKFLNIVDGGGAGSCHLATDSSGKTLFVANYTSGTVASFAINADGSIGHRIGFDQHTDPVGPNHARQDAPHAHEVVLSPDNRFLFVPDLGTDVIKIYRVDTAKGTFTPNDPPFVRVNAGLGPRHIAFGPGAKFAYAICEMGSSVVVFSYDSVNGSLKPLQTISTLPPDFTEEDNSSEIELGKSGRFLYASNRGNDSITVFAIDPHQGTVTKVQVEPTQGKIPRNFAIDPTGKYLVVGNQKSDQMIVFAIHDKDGQLKPTGQVVDVPEPVCIVFVPSASAPN